ncbi:MAG: hypothetical protein M0Z33_12085, partial [Actinomycetota bacterium]|nr:hypothetical protein [Actinomycetota bacterium]
MRVWASRAPRRASAVVALAAGWAGFASGAPPFSRSAYVAVGVPVLVAVALAPSRRGGGARHVSPGRAGPARAAGRRGRASCGDAPARS